MSSPLLKDLEELVRHHIISPETAGQIESYYASKKEAPSNRFTVVLAILGALLLSSGIVLVIAHNWDMLGRPLRTIIAFLPLVIGQALCIYAFLKKRTHTAWLEGTALFLFFAVPACISLISQIYQVNGSLSGFLFTWILLTLPLVYIMPSSMVSLLLIGLATWHGGMVGYSGEAGFFDGLPAEYLLVMLLLVPHYVQLLKRPSSNFFHWHNWLAALSFLIILGSFLQKRYSNYDWVFISYMALGGIFYLLGNTAVMKRQRWFANPYLLLGTLTIVILLLLWTFDWLWSSTRYLGEEKTISLDYLFTGLTAALLVVCAWLWIKQQSVRGTDAPDIMGLSPFVFTAGVLFLNGHSWLGMLLFNIWVLAIGIYYTRKGALKDHLGILNFGLLIIAALALFRFFDNQIPFVWRGLMFIAAGAGFFIANSMLIKKRRATLKNS